MRSEGGPSERDPPSTPQSALTYNSPMPRTFSLARLMLGITAVCIVLGLANYSETTFAYLLTFCLFLPTAAVCLALVSYLRKRNAVLTWSILGALVSWFISSPVNQRSPSISVPSVRAGWPSIEQDRTSNCSSQAGYPPRSNEPPKVAQ